MNRDGLYLVFEGIDGSGKSTIASMLAEHVKALNPTKKIISTYHPGSTALGKHLRNLVKNPAQFDDQIKIDNLSRQMLHFVDTISFHKTILEPELKNGTIILSDRCTYISSIIYGLATGLSIKDVTNLFAIYPPVKADLVFVFDTDWEVAKQRIQSRDTTDFYDDQKEDFFKSITAYYKNIRKAPLEQMLLINQVVSLSNLHMVDSNQCIDKVFESILPHVDRALSQSESTEQSA